jgi:hypothetical protein
LHILVNFSIIFKSSPIKLETLKRTKRIGKVYAKKLKLEIFIAKSAKQLKAQDTKLVNDLK